jgi:hypothetical protein
MKRLLVTLASAMAVLALGTGPASALGPGDPFSTDCASIDALAGQVPAAVLLSLAGETASGLAQVKIQPQPPVTFTTTSDGGCLVQVNP